MKKFSHERFNELLTEVTADIRKLSDLKGGEYAGDTDRLANFRRNAEAMGVPMETIWGVYAAKHWDAIMQYVQDKNTGKTRTRMEPIKGRASDLIVYLCLFMAICEEADSVPDTQAAPGGVYETVAAGMPPILSPDDLIEYQMADGVQNWWPAKAIDLNWNLPIGHPAHIVRWRYA